MNRLTKFLSFYNINFFLTSSFIILYKIPEYMKNIELHGYDKSINY
jgi:hypothetical protein